MPPPVRLATSSWDLNNTWTQKVCWQPWLQFHFYVHSRVLVFRYLPLLCKLLFWCPDATMAINGEILRYGTLGYGRGNTILAAFAIVVGIPA